MVRAFDLGQADFSAISDHSEGLCISEVIHRARVRIVVDSKQGAEQAATAADAGV